jgi:hypothetical protein
MMLRLTGGYESVNKIDSASANCENERETESRSLNRWSKA